LPLYFLDVGKKSLYSIGFTGLPDGKHQFNYKIDETLFEEFDYTEIKKAKLSVNLELEKKPNLMIADFSVSGKINIMCDVCTDYFDINLRGFGQLIYKFSDEDLDDENVVTVYPNETEIDVAQPIYEFTLLLIPTKRVHSKGKCNQEMIKDIDKYLMVEIEPNLNHPDKENKNECDADPRWDALKKLKKK